MNPIAERMYAKKAADANTRVRVGAGVIVLDSRGWILLEKRSDCGMWGLPGGRIEPGESVTEAAVREVYEETGLTVEITRLLGVYSDPESRIVTFLDNGDVVHLVDILLEAKIISGELSISSESEALHFFNRTTLPSDIVPPALAPLQDFLQGETGIIR
ncbi:NUDIX domain-containing protein [Microcoleus sp. MON1_C1]|uniref:NUDIX domain-containing protein n=1 Tax=Microcoleus sp. MON1_C1 TaxID=2818827 RepID=UPI002FD10BC3